MIAKQELKKQREPEKLHERYGKIGISAVVAALTYQMPKISLTPPSRPATTSGTKKRRDQDGGEPPSHSPNGGVVQHPTAGNRACMNCMPRNFSDPWADIASIFR